MKKKSWYQSNKKNGKLQLLQNEFDNYKRKNDVNVAAVLEARKEIERLRKALKKIESMLHEEASPKINSEREMKQQFHKWFLEACYTAEQALAGESNDA